VQEQSQPNQACAKSECIYLNISWGSLPFFARRFEGLRLAAVDVAEAILLSQVSDQQNLQGWRVAGGLECSSSLTSKQAQGPYSTPRESSPSYLPAALQSAGCIASKCRHRPAQVFGAFAGTSQLRDLLPVLLISAKRL
jgi:hypothetical protein